MRREDWREKISFGEKHLLVVRSLALGRGTNHSYCVFLLLIVNNTQRNSPLIIPLLLFTLLVLWFVTGILFSYELFTLLSIINFLECLYIAVYFISSL